MSESNQAALQAIAEQCRYEGGLAVVQARACIGDEWEWQVYDNCPDAQTERNAKGFTAVGLTLPPNPAADAALLNIGNGVTSVHIVLRNLNGRALQSWELHGQQQIWLQWGAELPSGLYLLEFVADQSAPQVLKLVIERN